MIKPKQLTTKSLPSTAADIGDVSVQEAMAGVVVFPKGVKFLLGEILLIQRGDEVVQGFGQRAPGLSAKLKVFLMVMSSVSFRDVCGYRS